MTEDTRKDKRAKIVSLNVRYKSATVDEFIENHSHDVSKGGIFIKTPTPFPPGTLIKFEIRIANDKAVIMGVGRVVWKREPSQSAGERPSGMGVKFIKIDDSSRLLIDRVVAEKEGAGAAYATENEAGEGAVKAATRPISDSPMAKSDPPRIVAGAPGSLRPGEIRKETIMGIGDSSPPPKAAAKPGEVDMFPKTASALETGPVKEKTVMKQAAELLEEALKEAGGSMDEIGNNPLFAEGNKLAPRVGTADLDAGKKKGTLIGMPAASSGSTPTAKPSSDPPAAATAAKTTSDAPKKVTSSPPTVRETPSAKMAAEDPSPTSRQRKTDPPVGRPVSAAPPKAEDMVAAKKGGGGGVIWVLVLVLAAGGIAFVYKDNLLGMQTPAPTVTAPVPTPAPTPSVTASAAPTAEPSASAAPSASASAAPSASAAASASAKAAPSVAPAPTPAPTPTVAAPAPTPKPAPPPKPAPTPTAAAATDTPAPAPPPKPKPKPKPATPDTDNPY